MFELGQYLTGESGHLFRGWQLDVEGKLWLHCPCVGLVWALCWKYASSVTGILYAANNYIIGLDQQNLSCTRIWGSGKQLVTRVHESLPPLSSFSHKGFTSAKVQPSFEKLAPFSVLQL